jgi:hypothetical protein
VEQSREYAICFELIYTLIYFSTKKKKKEQRKLHQILKRGYSMWQTFSLARKGILVSYDRSFEDHKDSGEIKEFFLQDSYLWTAAFDLNIASFHIFLDLFSSTS